jgi:hypothetical protein
VTPPRLGARGAALRGSRERPKVTRQQGRAHPIHGLPLKTRGQPRTASQDICATKDWPTLPAIHGHLHACLTVQPSYTIDILWPATFLSVFKAKTCYPASRIHKNLGPASLYHRKGRLVAHSLPWWLSPERRGELNPGLGCGHVGCRAQAGLLHTLMAALSLEFGGGGQGRQGLEDVQLIQRRTLVLSI